jgi:hypothetical protein
MGALDFNPVALLGTAVLTSWTGIGVGLLVSATWRRAEPAVGTIVLLLVPQIAFSGVLMPLDEARTAAQWAASLTPLRYAFHLALRTGDRLEYLKLGEWHQRPVSGELFLMGLRSSGEGSLGWSPGVLGSFLVLVGLAGLGLAIVRTSRWVR